MWSDDDVGEKGVDVRATRAAHVMRGRPGEVDGDRIGLGWGIGPDGTEMG